MSENEIPGPVPQIQAAILENVEQHGCAVLHDSDPAVPDRHISASVGFETAVDQPEVIIFGLDDDLARSMIMETFRQCKEEGLELSDGQKIGNLIEGYDCMARAIDDPRARFTYFAAANWYLRTHQDRPVKRAVQIVWPDPQTKAFPWEEACGQDIAHWQTALYPRGGTQ